MKAFNLAKLAKCALKNFYFHSSDILGDNLSLVNPCFQNTIFKSIGLTKEFLQVFQASLLVKKHWKKSDKSGIRNFSYIKKVPKLGYFLQ